MAAVVRRPDNLSGALTGLTGAFQGMVEGEAVVEEKRQFNTEQAFKERQLQQQQTQWDSDMEFRYKSLQQMKEEGLLGREHESKLAQLDDIRQRAMQQIGIEALERMTRDIEQPWNELQNARDREVQKRGQDKTYSASVYSTRKGFEANMTQLADQRNKIQSDAGNAIRIGNEVLGNVDYNSLAPEQKEAAEQRFVEMFGTPERVHGSEGVPQMSDQEYAAAKARARDTLANLTARKDTYYKDLTSIAAAEAAARSGQVANATGRVALTFGEPNKDWTDVYGAGLPPRDDTSMSVSDQNLDNEIFVEVIPGIHAEAIKGDEAFRQSQLGPWKQRMDSKLEKMGYMSDEVRNYYYEALNRVLFPSQYADMATLTIDEEG